MKVSSDSAPAAGTHLDDPTAMMLADGELLPDASAHAAHCTTCLARVAAFRREAATLAELFTLDPDEKSFLQAAGLPARAAAWVSAPPNARTALDGRWETARTLVVVLGVSAAGAVGWQVTTALLSTGAETARLAGATTLIAGLAVGWAIGFVQLCWQVASVAGELPFLDEPALPLLALSLLLWAAAAFVPARTPPTVMGSDPSV